MSDPVEGLVFRHGWAGARDRLPRRLHAVAWLAVLLVHLLLAVFWGYATRWREAATRGALEVIWLVPRVETVVNLPPPMPVAPRRRPDSPASGGSPIPHGPAPIRSDDQANQASSQAPPATWLMPDGRLRVAHEPDPIPAWGDQQRISRERLTRLPGDSDAAAAEKVRLRLRQAFTPEDVVRAVVRFLTGGARPDDCRTIQRRLFMSDPGVSREIDLVKFRKTCTP